MRVLVFLSCIVISSAGLIGYPFGPFGYNYPYPNFISPPLTTYTFTRPFATTYTSLYSFPLGTNFLPTNLFPGNLIISGVPGVTGIAGVPGVPGVVQIVPGIPADTNNNKKNDNKDAMNNADEKDDKDSTKEETTEKLKDQNEAEDLKEKKKKSL